MNRNKHSTRDNCPIRRGAAMVFALMALLVASMMLAALLRTSALSHRQLKREEFRLQASLLADAGCARGIAQLQRQPDFTGEDWNVPAEQFSSSRTATVRLKVKVSPDQPDRRVISVIAEYPVGQPDVVRISREMSIP